MKNKLIKVGSLVVLIMIPVFFTMSVKNAGMFSYDWYSYFPNQDKLYCYAQGALTSSLRSYLHSVSAALALQGDPEAMQVFHNLVATYAPSELICYMSAGAVSDVAKVVNIMLPQIPGVSLVAEQVISAALYEALEKLGYNYTNRWI